MDIAKLKKSRGAIRRIFTKTKHEIEGLISVNRQDIDFIKIKALLEVLETHYQSLLKEDSTIYQFLLEQDNTTDSEIDDEMDSQKEYGLTYQIVKHTVDKLLIEEDKQSVSLRSQMSDQVGLGFNMTSCSYKLPLLKFKEFDGELKNWLPFWAQFSKIDSDKSLSSNDKIQYLVMATLPNSVAREVVESYPATGEMYPEVIKALKSRFGRKDLLTEYYIRELLKIVISNASSLTKLPLSELYDKLQCHLRNLATLEVSSETCAPILLPLVSSCLPEDVLKLWERSGFKLSTSHNNEGNTSKELLENLLTFLKGEIEGEQKVKLALSGFGLSSNLKEKVKPSKYSTSASVGRSSDISTAAGLFTADKNGKTPVISCIFCSLSHRSQDCIKAQSMLLTERKSIVNSKKVCFCCLKGGHIASKCRNRPKCILCKKSHFVIMCDSVSQTKNKTSDNSFDESQPERCNVNTVPKTNEALASHLNTCSVLMQTLQVNLIGPNGVHCVRALIDSASQRSYILSSTAAKVGYIPSYQENMQHLLFGGNTTDVICHNAYEINISSLDDNYRCHFEVLDQSTICGQISSVVQGPWTEELARKNIKLSDVDSNGPIEILIGADVAGRLWTGGHVTLTCGLVAIETKLGWTLMGKVPKTGPKKGNVALLVTTMLTTEAKITDLWNLDSLGILDPYEKCSRQELETETQKHFLETVSITDEGRYEVCLPWIQDHSPLPDNYQLAKQRLCSTLKKLQNEKLYDKYQGVFDSWLQENIIEEVPKSEIDKLSHYLPHRPVLKPNSTTPVRPVFDASAHEYKSPSLNQCLEKGPNLIEKITSVMARFRMKKIGVIGDIRKAFLQIVVSQRDRDFLRFLWTTKEGEDKVFRHCRVVFGVSSSPFLLEASLKLHLEETLAQCKRGELDWSIDLVKTLASSFYVDNCVCSLRNREEAHTFIEMASQVMNERKFELRGWEMTTDEEKDVPSECPLKSNVLGLLWDRTMDTLEVNLPNVQEIDCTNITKRIILSTAHRIFDPIGFTCPVTLVPKLLLQHAWTNNISWDQEVDTEIKEMFVVWLRDIHFLQQIKIPRWLPGTNYIKGWTLHMFSDASQVSYASVAFLRVELEDHVRVQLIAAKSRVAPISKTTKKMTIPRLELLAASISVRLHNTIINDYEFSNIKTYFWTDATTVLAWIEREDFWNVFVHNRVSEIKRITSEHEWRYVPGCLNPADLPSRGCSARKLQESRWWEGPTWLRAPPTDWPQLDTQYNEEDINCERKKSVVSALSSVSQNGWLHGGCSSFKKTVRMVGWIYRFKNNALTKNEKLKGDLCCDEFIFAENKLLSLVQSESFLGLKDSKLSSFVSFNSDGLIRVKTKVSNKEDTNDFCNPIVLPNAKHPIVFSLIMDTHKDNCHVGSQMIMTILRQRFWILGGRRTIKSVLNSCIICKRYESKQVESLPTPLPTDRVRNAKVFEVTGVDLTGPLYLKIEKKTCKAWVCLFTCSVYRAIHLELLTSLSTDSFLMGLRRFISRRGRPSVIYSDNGTNFIGTDNCFKKLNWISIEQYSSVRKIHWKYSPPTGPWWRGWWERLIGILKKLLRKVLGNSYVTQEEMQTILCDCEAIINSRPLTYVSDDSLDLTPLTPSLFLQDVEEVGIPDFDLVEASDLNQRLKYRQKLKQCLMNRFRTEYLGQLQLHANKNKPYELTVGEVVLVGSEGLKRLKWPLGRIIELIQGKDGNVRLVRLRTQKGELLRPVQRIFPLEIKSNSQEAEVIQKHLEQVINHECEAPRNVSSTKKFAKNTIEPLSTGKITRSGREVHMPKRFEH